MRAVQPAGRAHRLSDSGPRPWRFAALIGRFGGGQNSSLILSLDSIEEEAIRSASVTLDQGGAGLIQEGLRDLAADGFQLGDALLQLLDVGLIAGLDIHQLTLNLRLLGLQLPAFFLMGFPSYFLFPLLEIGLVLTFLRLRITTPSWMVLLLLLR